MFKFIKKKEEHMPEENDNIIDKLQENNTVINKLDFNVDYLNRYLIECITAYFSAIYKQDPLLCQKYVTENFYKSLCKDVEENKKIFKYSNDNINIEKAELVEQKIESVNYISSIVINVKISAVYHRQHIFTGTVKKIEEVYEESILFKNSDNGWKIDNIISQNFIYVNDDIIIKL